VENELKLIEILKNGKRILLGEGEHNIKSPIEIRITIEEDKFNEIQKIADYYKWSLYDTLEEILYSDPKETIEKAEMKYQGII
jgi:hypothetical protein